MSFSPALIAIAVALAIPFSLSVRRFRALWRDLATRYGRTQVGPRPIPAERFSNVYCEARAGGRTVTSPAITVELTASGVALIPGLWHRTLPAVWIPWTMVAECEPATRPLARTIAQCVRLQLADEEGWFLIDYPAGERLHRFWRSPAIRRTAAPAGH